MPNLKSVALIVCELLAFNDEKFRGSRDTGYTPFWNNFWTSCPYCIAFNAQKFRGSRDPATPPFGKIFGGHIWTVHGNMCVKFEVRSFNRF